MLFDKLFNSFFKPVAVIKCSDIELQKRILDSVIKDSNKSYFQFREDGTLNWDLDHKKAPEYVYGMYHRYEGNYYFIPFSTIMEYCKENDLVYYGGISDTGFDMCEVCKKKEP